MSLRTLYVFLACLAWGVRGRRARVGGNRRDSASEQSSNGAASASVDPQPTDRREPLSETRALSALLAHTNPKAGFNVFALGSRPPAANSRLKQSWQRVGKVVAESQEESAPQPEEPARASQEEPARASQVVAEQEEQVPLWGGKLPPTPSYYGEEEARGMTLEEATALVTKPFQGFGPNFDQPLSRNSFEPGTIEWKYYEWLINSKARAKARAYFRGLTELSEEDEYSYGLSGPESPSLKGAYWFCLVAFITIGPWLWDYWVITQDFDSILEAGFEDKLYGYGW